MTVQHSHLGLSDIGYHLYTIFLFIKNDILTAIIPVVRMVLALYCCPLHILPDTVFGGFGTIVQPHPHLAYHLLDLAPSFSVQPCEPGQGARGRQGEQTIAANSSRENHCTRRDNSPVVYGPAVPGVLLAV